MGLPLWSSVGFGNEENKPTTKSEPTAPRRSPIQRSFPTREASLVDPDTGAVRYFRRPVRRRGIPPQVPVPQPQSDSYQPNVRSPLVPSLGAIGAVISRAQRVLGLAHVEMDRLLARQYIPHLVTQTRNERSDRALTDELDTLLRSARDFSENTREQITYLVRWERNLLRGELIGPQMTAEFHQELESLVTDCEVAKRTIKARLEQFQSWATDAREGIASHRLATTQRPTTDRDATPRFLNEAPITRSASDASRNIPTVVLHNHDRNRPFRSSRVAGSAPRVSATATLDGLGDRLRSASPEHDTDADTDAWDTMRMTLEPDDRLPSTDSSFTSAAASASFSAPSDRSGSTSAPLSAASSRTDLSIPLFDDEDCGPFDDRHEQSTLPEVLPSPLFRDMSGRNGAPDTSNASFIPTRRHRMLPPLYGERPHRDLRDRLMPRPQPSPGLNSSFMFSAPRSQSPLSFVTNNGVSTGPHSASEAIDRPALPLSARPILSSPATVVATSNAPLDGDVSAVMRLAFQYASAVASSSDPHTDPELEHMRRMFSTVANSDGQLNEDWWMSAGIAPYLADDNDSVHDHSDQHDTTR